MTHGKNVFIMAVLSIMFNQLFYGQEQTIEISTDVILRDFKRGEISVDEWAVNSFDAIFKTNRLPEKYVGYLPGRESTELYDKILQYWPQLKESTKEYLYQFGLNSRGAMRFPSTYDTIVQSDHFEFYFTVEKGDTNAVDTTDIDLNGRPDFIDEMILAFETTYNTEITKIGFNLPPQNNLGDKNKFDVYIGKIKDKIYGLCYRDSLVGDNPNSTKIEKNAYTSFIKMRNEYEGFSQYEDESISVTAAHEYFHAINNGYDALEKTWLKESLATWSEDEVFDNINENYGYLTSWFYYPDIPLDATKTEKKNHWYGSFIFIKYLTERFGGAGFAKTILEKSVEDNSDLGDFSFKAIEKALSEKDAKFDEVFQGFCITNLIKTIPPYHYEEGRNYPNIKIKQQILSTERGITDTLKRHSAVYYGITPNAASDDEESIEFNLWVEPTQAQTDLAIIKVKGNNVEKTIISKTNGMGTYKIENSSEFDKIYAIIINADSIITNTSFDVVYKGKLRMLSNIGQYSYGQMKDNYYINFYNREAVDEDQNYYYEYILNQYSFKDGFSKKEIISKNYLFAHLGGYDGRMFLVMQDDDGILQNKYYTPASGIKAYTAEFSMSGEPVLSDFTIYFEGGIYSGENYIKGVWKLKFFDSSPELIYDMTDTDLYADFMDTYDYGMAFLVSDWSTGDQKEIIRSMTSSNRIIYSVPQDRIVQNLLQTSYYTVWVESDYMWNDMKIMMKSIASDSLVIIHKSDGLDQYSLSGVEDKIIWWENTTGTTEIKMWKTDSVRTIRRTNKGLYLNDNGISANHFGFSTDKKGFVWMEGDFMIYFYRFDDDYLLSFDVSKYFENDFLTNYLVKHSENNIIIEAISEVGTDQVGVYLFNIDGDVTNIKDEEINEIPEKYNLSQNYPNPFNPITKINLSLPQNEKVVLSVYNILGEKVKTLINKKLKKGVHTVEFDGSKLASGVYIYQIICESFISSKKMMLLK